MQGPAAGGRSDRAGRHGLAPAAVDGRLLVSRIGLGPAPRRAGHRPGRRPRGPADRLRREVPALLRRRGHRHLPAGGARRGRTTPTARWCSTPRLHTARRVALAGIPTRARVSPSGHMVAWTVFVGGDSYARHELLHPHLDPRHQDRASSTSTWRTTASSATAAASAPPTSTSGASPSPTTTALLRHARRPAATPTWSGATSPTRTRRHPAHERRVPVAVPRRHPHRLQEARAGPVARRPLAAVRPGPAHAAGDPDGRDPQRRRPGRLVRRPTPSSTPCPATTAPTCAPSPPTAPARPAA